MTLEVVIELNAVIVAVTDEVPRVLVVQQGEQPASAAAAGTERSADDAVLDALPFGPLDPAGDRTLERGLRGWVREQTGLDLGYAEQLYTFGDRHRDPREREDGTRVISVAYLALVREGKPSGEQTARWREWYGYVPWEDWREGRPHVIPARIVPALESWIKRTRSRSRRQERRERAEIAFGLGGAAWDSERVLERYELLYEVGAVEEARRDRRGGGGTRTGKGTRQRRATMLGREMALDHRRILATALGRLRGKLKYRPLVFELLPATFTLFQLQRVVEALAGLRLHKGNFRRLVERGGLVEGTGDFDAGTGGRPAELFRFRREVLRERRAPGVGLPGVPHP